MVHHNCSFWGWLTQFLGDCYFLKITITKNSFWVTVIFLILNDHDARGRPRLGALGGVLTKLKVNNVGAWTAGGPAVLLARRADVALSI